MGQKLLHTFVIGWANRQTISSIYTLLEYNILLLVHLFLKKIFLAKNDGSVSLQP